MVKTRSREHITKKCRSISYKHIKQICSEKLSKEKFDVHGKDKTKVRCLLQSPECTV